MKKIFNIIQPLACTMVLVAMTACGEKEFYDEEQYRKECYIVSGEDNIFGQEYTFGENSVGYISIYTSGSTPVDKEVTVTLRTADDLLKAYNQRVNGTTYANYAEILPQTCYNMPEGWSVKVTPDNCYTLFPISVNIDQLNTSKTYFLPLEIASVSDYQYSATKNYVLFRIYMKNNYATTKKDTYYQMYGTTIDLQDDGTTFSQVDPAAVPTVFNATKRMDPISENAVSIIPGATQTSTDTESRNIQLTVTNDIWQKPIIGDDGLPTGQTIPVQRVLVAPKNEGSTCVQVTKAYDSETGEELYSYFNPADNTFTLNYCYRMPSERSGTKLLWHKVREEMARMN